MIRVYLLWLLLLISLLTVLKAPAYYLWLLSVIVTEFPWVFIIVTLILLICNPGTGRYNTWAVAPGLIALALFCSPVVRAYGVAAQLKFDFEQHFGKGSNRLNADTEQKPFSLFKMLTGIGHTLLPYRVLHYSPALTLDYYSSAKPGKRPCIIIIHGGSWSSGDSKQLPELNTQLAESGYHVAAVNYRLAPQHQSPAAVLDVQQAIGYLKQHAGELNIDTNRLVLLGRSAGGQIALQAAYTLKEPGIKGVIAYYAPADMVWGYSKPASPLVMDSRKVMENYLGGTYAQVPHQYEASSPLLAVNRQSVPTLLIHGCNDVLVAYEHSIRLNLKLQQLGVPHFLLSLPWATHGCDYTLNGPSGQLATYTVDRFLNQVTK